MTVNTPMDLTCLDPTLIRVMEIREISASNLEVRVHLYDYVIQLFHTSKPYVLLYPKNKDL